MHLHFVTSSIVTVAKRRATAKARKAAVVDWDEFGQLGISRLEIDAVSICLAQPPILYPFTALTELRLKVPVLGGDELALVFCTNLFPNLKTLKRAI